jgi:hypothetical protein
LLAHLLDQHLELQRGLRQLGVDVTSQDNLAPESDDHGVIDILPIDPGDPDRALA